jgi:hypothetical protein
MQECPLGLSFAKCHFHHTIMPRMVSFQKDIKRYHRLLGHMILVILILVAHIKKCPCVPGNCFCVFRNVVSHVASTKLRNAFTGAQRAGNVEAVVQHQRRISQYPLILPRSRSTSIMSPHTGPASVSSSDPPFSLFTLWASMTNEWLS